MADAIASVNFSNLFGYLRSLRIDDFGENDEGDSTLSYFSYFNDWML